MRSIQVDAATYEMLAALSRKHSMNPSQIVETLAMPAYQQMKKTGRKVL